jgi:dolichyl-phosphate-mannose--protein O-mannosyl transferase
MIRPIWLYYQASAGTIRGIIEIGNIITWVGGLFLLVQCVIKTWQAKESDIKFRNGYLILSYLVLYLPWIAISRVKFIYHYFPAVLVLLIISAIMLDELWEEHATHKYWIVAYFMIAAAFFIYFLPLLMGWPITEPFYRQHMWLKSWI